MKKSKIYTGLIAAALLLTPILYIVINNAIVNKQDKAYEAEIKELESRYTVLSKETNPQASKVSYVVMLHRECNKEEIKEIAHELKSNYPYQDRVFIEYYLEGFDSNGVAWATSHFNRNSLNVRFNQ